VEEELAHGAERGGRSASNDKGSYCEHREAPPTTPPVKTETGKHVVPIGGARGGGKDAFEAAAVKIDHVRASSRRLRRAAWAALRVAATVPVRIPSASPIAS
jgi:hypothetical protein